MSSDPVTACSCCGTVIEPGDRFDIRVHLPDAALANPDKQRHRPMDALLLVEDEGAFLRVLLPVRLTSGSELVFGTWLRISDEDARRAYDIWEEPAYADLVLTGTLGNAIKPWGDRLCGPVTAVVRHTTEIPYVDSSTDPYIARIIGEEWDHDQVLERMPMPLPYPVRPDLGDGWSIERTPGLDAAFADGYDRFTSPTRRVTVGILTDAEDRSVEQSFQDLTNGIRPVPDEDKLIIRTDDEIRYAELVTTETDGQTEYTLYGLVVREGSALDVRCHYQDPDDRAWALHVWRSAARVAEG